MHGHDQHNASEWDERYANQHEGAPLWSGGANGTLVAEVADLAPGTVLDVGSGEGGDAIWLAQHGWQVTAVEPSRVALDRAEAAAGAAGVEVRWVHAGLLDMPADAGVYDLVSAQYPALRHTDDDAAITALLGAVAPGGTLLVVHHLVLHDHDHGHGHEDRDDDFDPADYVLPDDVAAHLDDDWEVEVHETRPRPGPLPADARHVDDIVLRVRRRAAPIDNARSAEG